MEANILHSRAMPHVGCLIYRDEHPKRYKFKYCQSPVYILPKPLPFLPHLSSSHRIMIICVPCPFYICRSSQGHLVHPSATESDCTPYTHSSGSISSLLHLLQEFKPELGPMSRRVETTFLEGIYSDKVNMEETDYWFTEPEGQTSMLA